MTTQNNLEIEVKLYVQDLNAVAERLVHAGAELVAPRIYERNVRYDTPDGLLARSDEVLRLRQDTRVRLTYKGSADAIPTVVDSGIRARFEAELEVSSFEQMALILGRLGFSAVMVYEKYRTTYTLDGVEVVLDEMPYGSFVELEGESAEAIEAIIAQLALGQAARFSASYVLLFEFVRQNLNLSFTDLTFANFTDIAVPQTAFNPPHHP